MIKDANYLREVREHYENYPYPFRDPKDEETKLIQTHLSNFEAINHYCYRGKQTFENFDVLVAGCGTGDDVIFCAEFFKNMPSSRVVALDMTEASLNVAKERAKVRGLTNITWIHNSLMELPNMDIGKFDYINCSGVLHHLEDPDAGLLALKSVLKDDGFIGLMLYAEHGRTGVYKMQELLRRIHENEEDLQVKVDNTKLLLNNLPRTNWFVHTAQIFKVDMIDYGDIGIYDLLLHSQDRAYTVPQVYDYVENAGLNFVSFIDPHNKKNYRTQSVVQDPKIRAIVEKLPLRKQQAICELLVGNVIKQTFFASMKSNTVADLSDLTYIPYFAKRNQSVAIDIANAIESLKPEHTAVRYKDASAEMNLIPTKNSAAIIKHIDNTRTLKEIFEKANSELKGKLSEDKFKAEFKEIFEQFETFNIMFLRASKETK